MKRKINISINATEENGAYKCHLQTGNILFKDFVVAMKMICNALEEKGDKKKAFIALVTIMLDSFGVDAIKELHSSIVLAEKIEKKKLDFMN